MIDNNATATARKRKEKGDVHYMFPGGMRNECRWPQCSIGRERSRLSKKRERANSPSAGAWRSRDVVQFVSECEKPGILNEYEGKGMYGVTANAFWCAGWYYDPRLSLDRDHGRSISSGRDLSGNRGKAHRWL